MQETQVLSLGWEDHLEKGMATHSKHSKIIHLKCFYCFSQSIVSLFQLNYIVRPLIGDTKNIGSKHKIQARSNILAQDGWSLVQALGTRREQITIVDLSTQTCCCSITEYPSRLSKESSIPIKHSERIHIQQNGRNHYYIINNVLILLLVNFSSNDKFLLHEQKNK